MINRSNKRRKVVSKEITDTKDTVPVNKLTVPPITTEKEWNKFLESRFKDETQIDDEAEGNQQIWWKGDWKPPEIKVNWEQGPIGQIKNWWEEDESLQKIIYAKKAEDKETEENKKKKMSANDRIREKKKKEQLQAIKKDVTKELKRQQLEKQLRKRIEEGKVVKSIAEISDQNNNESDAFVSFFEGALGQKKSGDDDNDDDENNDEDGKGLGNKGKTKEEEEEIKLQKKIYLKQQRKLRKPVFKTIASFENDSLFFIDNSDDVSSSQFHDPISNQSLLDFIESDNGPIASTNVNDSNITKSHNNNAKSNSLASNHASTKNTPSSAANTTEMRISSENLLTGILPNEKRNEKKLLKKLNIMDYVIRYRDDFYREIEELQINRDSLVQNWRSIKQHSSLSRKLKKKLGIIMARYRLINYKKQIKKLDKKVLINIFDVKKMFRMYSKIGRDMNELHKDRIFSNIFFSEFGAHFNISFHMLMTKNMNLEKSKSHNKKT
ncbi:C2 domain containing protein [Reticulomyxa filosa]|uniref:C2 domain containing protein n=1 Tax=Reticulomyxa filosa TaxID=46433 RepID=X6M6K3_RETFI|nr:C2 domain containing protein [Reticulomyxa filosa]|eukprot:ETO09092.1 C2 domain containing protein [Reticulomyxa filosa]